MGWRSKWISTWITCQSFQSNIKINFGRKIILNFSILKKNKCQGWNFGNRLSKRNWRLSTGWLWSILRINCVWWRSESRWWSCVGPKYFFFFFVFFFQKKLIFIEFIFVLNEIVLQMLLIVWHYLQSWNMEGLFHFNLSINMLFIWKKKRKII